MSSTSPSLSPSPSSPNRHENLTGAILWLFSKDEMPDHGRYKLKAKACGHPCVVVEDCRSQNDDFVRICILTSYSGTSPYNAISPEERAYLVPIHPNAPNLSARPSIVYLRSRQKIRLLLKKPSWIHTKQTYKVPVSVLRPYETSQSWCRYRLTESSIQTLCSALFEDISGAGPATPLLQAPRMSFASPVFNGYQDEPDDEQNTLASGFGIYTQPMPQQYLATEFGTQITEDPFVEYSHSTNTEPRPSQQQDYQNEFDNTATQDVYFGTDIEANQALPRQHYPFHSAYPFDGGPCAGEIEDMSNEDSETFSLVPSTSAASSASSQRPSQSRVRLRRVLGFLVIVSLSAPLVAVLLRCFWPQLWASWPTSLAAPKLLRGFW